MLGSAAISHSQNPVWALENNIADEVILDGNASFFRMFLTKRAEILSNCSLIILVADASPLIGNYQCIFLQSNNTLFYVPVFTLYFNLL